MSIYHKDVTHLKTLDPYRLQELYQMHPCAEHVVKKLLVAGEREGAKDLDVDISDCIRTLKRWQEMRAEDAALRFTTVDATCEAGPEICGTTRYDWSIPSERFKWLALTAAGEAIAFTHEPTRDRHEWKPTTGEYRRFPSLDQFDATDEDWTQTLEARPV